MTSSVHDLSSHSDNGGADEQQKQSQGSQSHIRHPPPGTVLPGAALPSAEFMMMPHPSVGMGHNMGQTAYAYPDPYYASMMAAYGAQAPIHPNLVGMQQAGMPLPSGVIEEPVYVNAKQYHGILRRRQLRAKAESENKLIKSRKPYLHKSRHLHALKRARGCGGRFLNAKGNSDQTKEAPACSKLQSIDGPESSD